MKRQISMVLAALYVLTALCGSWSVSGQGFEMASAFLLDDDEGKLREFGRPYEGKKDEESGKKKEDDDGWLDFFFELLFCDGDEETTADRHRAETDDRTRVTYRFWGRPYRADGPAYIWVGDRGGSEASLHSNVFYHRIDHQTVGHSWYLQGRYRLFTIDGGQIHYAERLGGDTDRLKFSKFHLGFGIPIGPSNELLTDIGVGFSLLELQSDLHGGLSGQLALNYFPARPIFVRASGVVATIGSRDLYELEGRVGYLYGHLEGFVGIHSLINSKGDDLTGPTVGIGLWF